MPKEVTRHNIARSLKLVTTSMKTIGENAKETRTDSMQDSLLTMAKLQVTKLVENLQNYPVEILDLRDTNITEEDIGVLAKTTPKNITGFVFDERDVNINSNKIERLAQREATESITIGAWDYDKTPRATVITHEVNHAKNLVIS